MLGRSIRSVRSFSSVDWSAISSNVTSDSARAAVSRFRAVVSEVEQMADTYAGKKPEAIDFAGYKKKISAAGLVEAFEKEYAALAYPEFKASNDPELQAAQAKAVKDAEVAVNESKARITELKATVTMLMAKRTGRETTVDDVYEAYPAIKKEIDAEIENHEWHKDIN